jgi:hypothetical protein
VVHQADPCTVADLDPGLLRRDEPVWGAWPAAAVPRLGAGVLVLSESALIWAQRNLLSTPGTRIRYREIHGVERPGENHVRLALMPKARTWQIQSRSEVSGGDEFAEALESFLE